MSAPLDGWLAVAGEASGDALLAEVVTTAGAEGLISPGGWSGVGADASAAAGLNLVAHGRDLAGHGLGEALGTVPALISTWRRLRRRLPEARGILLVDFPELNSRLLSAADGLDVPGAWLSPPQAWAWRPWRARQVKRARWVGCLMPFEVSWYQARGVPATWVGHPLAARPQPPMPTRPRLCLLPGSRDPSVRRMLPLMLTAAARLRRAAPELGLALPVASTVDRGWVLQAIRAADLPVQIYDDAPSALAASTVAVSTAGTACLEAALAGRPTLILGHLPPGAAAVARALVRADHVGLPNLILQRRALPELWLEGCTPAAIAEGVEGLLAAPAQAAEALEELRARMHRPGFAGRVLEGLLAIDRGLG